MSDDRTNLARKLDDHESTWVRPEGEVLAFPAKRARRRAKQATRMVDVFDSAGGHVAAYQVCLEDEGCLECEFEEVALLFAERSGRVRDDELHLMIARCHCD